MAERRTAADRAVDDFLAAKEELEAFMKDDEIREILMEMDRLVADYNSKLDTATRQVKSQLRTMDQQKLLIKGIGAQKKMKRWYDVEHLANALPADQSELILTERVTYDLDIQLLEQLRRQGEINNDIVAESYHEEEQNPSAMPGTPKPYTMPAIPVD
jgi:hypothetical protein